MNLKVTSHLPIQEEAEKISQKAVKQTLASGTLITRGKSHYNWNNQLKDEKYWKLELFTTTQNKEEIKNLITKETSEETPAIYWEKISGEKQFTNWIKKNS